MSLFINCSLKKMQCTHRECALWYSNWREWCALSRTMQSLSSKWDEISSKFAGAVHIGK